VADTHWYVTHGTLHMSEILLTRLADIKTFLLASRHAYNEFVLYHNFRHVVDVLQAIFYFLLQLGILPEYPPSDTPRTAGPKSAIASLLKPFDALTLLISAIGHDVGHPGVNNAFLVALNAPLAQLYNDRSVLESFHCAAYSQILRRYWPASFEDIGMRKLMINSILATDMGLHFKYMQDLGNLQEKLAHNNNSLDGWNLKIQEEYRDLACGLLIKCADISNVVSAFLNFVAGLPLTV
jgi:3',5'-cyclic-nucleotide phosphodiesterase